MIIIHCLGGVATAMVPAVASGVNRMKSWRSGDSSFDSAYAEEGELLPHTKFAFMFMLRYIWVIRVWGVCKFIHIKLGKSHCLHSQDYM